MNELNNDIVSKIAKRAGQNIRREEGDYEKDGLLYCGKCNTPKQCKVPFGDTYIKPPCLCKCATEERDAKETADKEFKRQQRILILRTQGIKDERLFSCTFDNDKQPDSKYSLFVKRYCEQWEKVLKENIGLILYGDTGRGKSFYAAAIANAIVDKGIPVLFRTESDILDELFDTTNKSGYIDKIASTPLLIIDDFGTRRDTAYATEQIKKIIDKRYYSEKPTIFTTNLTPDVFDKPKNIDEKRIYERVKAMGQFIEIKGKNWRQDEAGQKAASLMELLKEE